MDKARARILWTHESTQQRIEILKSLGLDKEYFASPWAKLPSDYRDKLASYYEEDRIRKIAREEARKALGKRAPIIHEAITYDIKDPFIPKEVTSAFPEGDDSVLTSSEKATIDRLIEEVPDSDDPLEINYWQGMAGKKVYLEGWTDKCLAGTGFPPMEGGEWDAKIEHMVRDVRKTLPEKERERGLRLIEGGFREFEAGDRGFLYGVTWGVYERG